MVSESFAKIFPLRSPYKTALSVIECAAMCLQDAGCTVIAFNMEERLCRVAGISNQTPVKDEMIELLSWPRWQFFRFRDCSAIPVKEKNICFKISVTKDWFSHDQLCMNKMRGRMLELQSMEDLYFWQKALYHFSYHSKYFVGATESNVGSGEFRWTRSGQAVDLAMWDDDEIHKDLAGIQACAYLDAEKFDSKLKRAPCNVSSYSGFCVLYPLSQ
ncbi:hypothetical protein PoB_004007100 [Plakobranchus ocellatus]|uniref:C-type lectin domain-containing protein n=1 Tax=Plakobranchus ocellatus TaxID=259542 RepID=A0AAV4AZ52_9GAST|nr:hypothetical protein PoB_004007100 [Plakobranchus ocellatus]